ncbi:chondroitinase family polysaccharide lyase [Lentisphaera profundi]|uniref:Chondroitinase family polysaccharide lyase n=1 Tax=Lentisphaera profundi TaxID=1658616 RepID=A0ABY7VSI8_9BACT|nr:chondroitinase family polysaccharide lyase [Lentisphaera profundi]WDE95739.1 chondroitinase family polysaccharide lyase [Lentisphaera profundi]
MRKIFLSLMSTFSLLAYSVEPLSFENADELSAWRGAAVISVEESFHEAASLKWQWQRGDQLSWTGPIKFLPQSENTEDKALSTFSFWIYNPKAIKDSFKISFLKDDHEHCYFEYQLNFTGWRTCWVSYERDMQGKAIKGMNQILLRAPQSSHSGTLFIDHFIPSSQVDPRHQMPDRQVPFVNPKVVVNANKHWMALNYFSNQKKTSFSISPQSYEEIKLVHQRFLELNDKKIKVTQKLVDDISTKNKKMILEKGKAVLLTYHGAIYGSTVKKKLLEGQLSAKDYTAFMLQIARAYQVAGTVHKLGLEQVFLALYQNMHKYAWAAGSGLGTLHHLGYPFRDYYPAMLLMKEPLRKAGLLQQAFDDMYWFCGFGKVYEDFETASYANIDILNTTSMGMLATALMAETTADQAYCLKSFQVWLNRGLKTAPGLKAPLKADGSLYHHRNHYPAYGRDALRGISPVIYLLSGGSFKLAEENHQQVNKALYMMRNYCNLRKWPLSISGRHPNAKGALDPGTYYWMAKSGSPDGKSKIDPQMAATYLRLVQNDRKYSRPFNELIKAGFKVESSPQGSWSMNYASLGIHRRDDWLFTVKGFSRYLWGAEIYNGANHYGRYLSNGHYQLMQPSEDLDMKGFDWNYLPGTTSMVLPFEELKANVVQVDEFSGNEELLISDQTFSGSLNLNRQGMFSMLLHSHPKYGGDLRAFKSYFMFDDMVVCLGSAINSTDKKNNTVTTLFQIPGEVKEEFKSKSFTDMKGNTWKIKEGSFKFSSGVQISPNQKNDELENSLYTKVWLDHGKAPIDAGYEYAFRIKSSNNSFTYELLQKDNEVHGISYGNKEAFAISKKSSSVNSKLFSQVNQACILMSQQQGKVLNLAICDPDLRLYQGREENQYDQQGIQKEVSIYSRQWAKNESKSSQVEILLKGEFKLLTKSKSVHLINGNHLKVQCQHGEPVKLSLERLK